MIISISQPAYLPWLGYFSRIAKSDLHIVLDSVQFEKNSFINRNKIIFNQKPIWLTIPVLTKKLFGHLSINTVEVDNKMNWKKKHILSIKQAYSKSYFFRDIEDFIDVFYEKEHNKLIDALRENLDFFFDYLSIKTPILYASHYSFKEKKSDLVLEICKKFGATKYLSGPLGRDYLDMNKFQDFNIDVIFDDYNHPTYSQNSSNFTPYLSVLDLIMNCGKTSKGILINE